MIELPEQWTFNIYKDQIGFCNEINKPIEQIKGSYTLLGKPDEIKEEDAMELVEQSIHSGLFAHYVKGIPVNTYCYKTALDSFHSALESEIYWNVNPIDIKGQTFSNEHENKWQQAQEKTFDRNRTLIFVKN